MPENEGGRRADRRTRAETVRELADDYESRGYAPGPSLAMAEWVVEVAEGAREGHVEESTINRVLPLLDDLQASKDDG